MECAEMNKQKIPTMFGLPDNRIILAIALLIVATWTFARLISKWDVHWVFFVLACNAIGIVTGTIANNVRGALIGGIVGLIVSIPLLFFDVFLWLVFTLPPHPQVDF